MVAGFLLTLLGLACFAPTGLDDTPIIHRRTLTSMGLGAFLMLLMQDWWVLAFWCVLCANALRFPRPGLQLSRLEAGVMLYGAYALGKGALTSDSIVTVLQGLALLGLVGVSFWLSEDHQFGQAQANHAEGLMVVSFSAGMALAGSQSAWWLILAPLYGGLLVLMRRKAVPGHAALWMWHILLLAIWLWQPWLGLALLLPYLGWLGWMAHRLRGRRDGLDGGRVHIWWTLLFCQWKSGWTACLFGFGWQSWAAWADSLALLQESKGVPDVVHFSHPHSEYVHILFEHGVVGLLLLIGWLASILWGAAQAGQLGQALLFPAVAIGSVALTSFPWSLPTDTHWGNMGVVVASLIVAMLLGGVQ